MEYNGYRSCAGVTGRDWQRVFSFIIGVFPDGDVGDKFFLFVRLYSSAIFLRFRTAICIFQLCTFSL